MAEPRPLYLLSPEGSHAGLDASLSGLDPTVVDTLAALRDREPGLVLLPLERLSAQTVLEALTRFVGGGWLLVLVVADEQGEASVALPVSLGWPTPAGELARWADGAEDARVLELRRVLDRVARARHDVNNPLTSAMAETQLALMDAEGDELRQGLETVQEQLRRIRDLVAELSVLKPLA